MSKNLNLVVLLSGLAFSAIAESSAPHPLTLVPIQKVSVDDEFWSPRLKLWEDVTIPDCFTKFDHDRGGAMNNFDRVRDGKTGGHAGPEWYDGLIYEMIRGSADFLALHPDSALQHRVEGYIDRIVAAADRDPQGYIETWTELEAPNHRWGLNGGNDVQQHELYNAGALVEAGIHWYRATGQTKLLLAAVRMANAMSALMGPKPKVNQVPGHSLGEEALVKLYRLFRDHPELKSKMSVPVHEEEYLKLAEFWIDTRGNHDGRSLNWGAYAQDDKPVSEQTEMEGHAVRDGLLCTGLAAVGDVSDRKEHLIDAERLWENMYHYKMYLTGGLGAGLGIEGFGENYYLPNNTAYAETCASVAGGFFDLNMELAFGDAKYADELERQLFNGALAGVSLAGTNYFYENPLETETPHERWAWHGCPCCPPMFLKLMGALSSYIYAQDANAVYVNQFIGSRSFLEINDSPVSVRQVTKYPWQGKVQIFVNPEKASQFDLFVRIPAWCEGTSSVDDLYRIVGRPETGGATLKVNGKTVKQMDRVRGYARVHRNWKKGDVVEMNFDMPVRQVVANAKVTADEGLVAVMRGPIVYCAETVDNPTGVHQLVVGPETDFKAEFKPGLLDGVTVVEGKVRAARSSHGKTSLRSAKLVMVPYYANANRDASTLRVWLPASLDKAVPLTLATESRVSSSCCWREDSVNAINDGRVPNKSSDKNVSRLSWWEHKGTSEWVQMEFPRATEVSTARVFWFADRPANGGCDVPKSWRLFYKEGKKWKPVDAKGDYGLAVDKFNDLTFAPVKTTALRIEVQLQPDWSGGICEWQVE